MSTLVKQAQTLLSKIEGNDATEEDIAQYYYLIKETALSSTISEEDVKLLQSEMLRVFYQSVFQELELKLENTLQQEGNQDTKDVLEIVENFVDGKSIVLRQQLNCPNYQPTPFKTKEEVCEYADWVIKNYPTSKWLKDGDSSKAFPIKSCIELDEFGGPFSAETYLSYCGYKFSYTKVGEAYEKIKGTTQKPSVDGNGMGAPNDGGMGTPNGGGT